MRWRKFVQFENNCSLHSLRPILVFEAGQEGKLRTVRYVYTPTTYGAYVNVVRRTDVRPSTAAYVLYGRRTLGRPPDMRERVVICARVQIFRPRIRVSQCKRKFTHERVALMRIFERGSQISP